MTQADLRAKIKSGDLSGWYFFAGEEDYLKSHYAAQIKKTVLADEAFAMFNHTAFNAQEIDFAVLRDAFYAPPMMADYKLIEWKNADFDSLKASELEAFFEICEQKDSYPYIIFVITALPTLDIGTEQKPSKLRRRLDSFFNVIPFPKSTDAQLLSWLKKHFDAEGVGVDAPTLNTMLFRVGHSMHILNEEINKLCAYAKANGKATVTAADVNDVCSANIECDSFALSNAIIEKNAEKAFVALADMKQQKEDPIRVLAQIEKIYSDLLTVALLLDEGKSADAISEITKLHAYKLKLYIGAIKKMGTKKLAKTLTSLIKTDTEAKSGGIAGYKAIEMFIIQNI